MASAPTKMRRRRRTGPHARTGTPQWLALLPYVLVLSGVAAGMGMYATNHFRRGSALFAVALLFGALARLVLPESQVGLLATRKKWLDVLTMVVFAAAIAAVASVVPTGK